MKTLTKNYPKLFLIGLLTLFVSIPAYTQWSSNSTTIYTTTRKVGIGISSASSILHVVGAAEGPIDPMYRAAVCGNNTSTSTSYPNSVGVYGRVVSTGGIAIYGDCTSSSGFGGYFKGKGYFSGNVGIGTTTPDYTLEVNGTIKCEEVIVDDVAADYVFEKKYVLKPLNEVEKFINENGHLPGVAPASETVKGVKQSEFNTKLLEKIEELTLYVIEQNKKIAEIEKENTELKSVINSIQ